MNDNSYVQENNGQAVSTVRMSGIMSRVFLLMFLGLAVSAAGAVAFSMIYQNAIREADGVMLRNLFTLMIVSIVLEIVFVIIANVALSKNNAVLGGIMYFLYAATNGVTLSSVLLTYEIGSVVNCLIGAAVVFVLMAAWGFVTKKNLSGIGNIGMMLLFGVIVTSLLNIIFFKSSTIDLMISVVGLAVFIGLTAYDTKKIKEFAASKGDYSDGSVAIFGALMLYLDFINIFLYILKIFGKRND